MLKLSESDYRIQTTMVLSLVSKPTADAPGANSKQEQRGCLKGCVWGCGGVMLLVFLLVGLLVVLLNRVPS